MHITEDDLSGKDIAALLQQHLAEMHSFSPACHVHAMPVERLRAADVTFFAARIDGLLAGCGALKEIDPLHGEVKSMRTADAFLRRGVGAAVLEHIIAVARSRDYRRLSLETGRTAPFHASHRLYRRYGFAECPPFADYSANDFSLCMTRAL
jgi:putative acetyltransferase